MNLTDETVPHISLSAERKVELEQILRKGNCLLKTYHEQVKNARRIAKENRTDFLNEIFEKHSAGEDLILDGVTIPAESVEQIVLVKKVESELICAYANLINKLARGWSRDISDVVLSFEDLRAEAYQAALDAVAHFTEDVKFSTFIHHCVQRHLYGICKSSNGLSNFSEGTIKLKSQYSNFSSEEGATFDSVVDKMNICEKEIKTLQSVLKGVKNITSLDKEEKRHMDIVDNNNHEPERENNIMLVLESLEFSELERAVLDGVLNSPNTRLGIGSISKKLINPKTNKPYSRMAFSLAWKRIKDKVLDAYKKAS